MGSRMTSDQSSSSCLIEPISIVHISKNLASHQRHLIQLYASLGYSQPTLLVERKFSELYQNILMAIKDQVNELEGEVEALTQEIEDLVGEIQYLRVYVDDHRLDRWDLEAILDHKVTITRLESLQGIKQELLHLKYARESQDLRLRNSGPALSLEYLQKLDKHYIEYDQEAPKPSSSSSYPTKDYDRARVDPELLSHLEGITILESGDNGFGHQRAMPRLIQHENLIHAHEKRILGLRKEARSHRRETDHSRNVGYWNSSLQNCSTRNERVADNSRASINYERSSQIRLTYILTSQEKVKVIRQELVQKSQGSMRPSSKNTRDRFGETQEVDT